MSYTLMIYCVLTTWEIYLFVAQRASLEFGRNMGVQSNVANQMLPLWYMTFWPNKIARWVLIYFVFQEYGFLISGILLAIPFVTNIIIPIPYKHFLPQFEKVLLRNIRLGDVSPSFALYSNLQEIRKELGMPQKGNSEFQNYNKPT